MNHYKRINFVKACSEHLNKLGYTNQCVDEFEGKVHLLGTNGYSFHMHDLHTVLNKGTKREQGERLHKALIQYRYAFERKDMY